MPLMTWSNTLSTGVQLFDEQHQKLVDMVNELFDGMQAGKGKESLGPILDRLISYTATHFKAEEEYMTRYSYPDIEAHKKEHEKLVAQVVDIQTKYKAGATDLLTMEVMNFLKNWLVKHIQGTDAKYGPFLNKCGVQ